MKAWKLSIALLSLSSSAFAGVHFDLPGLSGPQAIIGGTNVQSGDPVQSSTVLVVGKDGDSTFICSGSIIASDIILTAAHCLGRDGLATVVVVFRTDIAGQGPVVKAKDRRRMPGFATNAGRQDTDWDDLALIQLASPIPAGYSLARFLPSSSMLQTEGAVTLAGFGITVPVSTPDSTNNDGAGVLRKVSQSVTNANYGSTEFLVSLAGGKGACHGDSGGPAFVSQGSNLYLVGVASRMTSNDRVANNGNANDFSCSVEMVYTNALSQMDWIKSNMVQLQSNL